MRALNAISLLALLGTASGCDYLFMSAAVETAGSLPFSQLDSQATFDDTSPEAIVVVAVSRIQAMKFVAGVDDGVSFHADRLGVSANVKTDDGFVVINLKARSGKKRYGIIGVGLEENGVDRYDFPHSSTILAFDAPAGRVTYLGGLTVEFVSEGSTSFAQLRDDPALTQQQASAHVARRYPRIKSPLVKGRLEWLYKNGPG